MAVQFTFRRWNWYYVREPDRHYDEYIVAPVAVINEHQLLGNIPRHQVEAAEQELRVDLLNRSLKRLFTQGTKLELLFNKNETWEVA